MLSDNWADWSSSVNRTQIYVIIIYKEENTQKFYKFAEKFLGKIEKTTNQSNQRKQNAVKWRENARKNEGKKWNSPIISLP